MFAEQLLQFQPQGESVAGGALLMGAIGHIVLERPALVRKEGRRVRFRSFWSHGIHFRLQLFKAEFVSLFGSVQALDLGFLNEGIWEHLLLAVQWQGKPHQHEQENPADAHQKPQSRVRTNP